MANSLIDLIQDITDETSFLRFLRALREDCEASERAPEDRWESHSTRDFLRAAEDWGTRGDFGEGVHHGEPMLRRIACLMYAGKYRLRE